MLTEYFGGRYNILSVSDHVPETRFGIWFLNTNTWKLHVISRALEDLDRLIGAERPNDPVIVDIGCGFGHSLLMLREWAKPSRLIGVDVDPVALEAARCRASEAEVSVELVNAPAHRTGLSDACADIVFCHQTFHHLIAQEEALAEFRRILKPDGLLLFAESTRAYIFSLPIRALFRHPMHMQRTASEYVALVRKAGFDVPDAKVSLPYLWWSRPDLGLAERWFGRVPDGKQEQTLVNLVARRL